MASGFRASVLSTSDMLYDRMCTPCTENNLNAEGIFHCDVCKHDLCNVCEPLHARLHKSHIVKKCEDITDLPKQINELTMTTTACRKHRSKMQNMYCKNHGIVCCEDCASQDHSFCDVQNYMKEVPDVPSDCVPGRVADAVPGRRIAAFKRASSVPATGDCVAGRMEPLIRRADSIPGKIATDTSIKEESENVPKSHHPVTQANKPVTHSEVPVTTLENQSSNHIYKVTSRQQVNVKKASDNANACRITGICQLPDGSYVLIDNKNQKVKLLNENFAMISELKMSATPFDVLPAKSFDVLSATPLKNFDVLSAKPFDVCHIQNNEVAVSLSSSKVQFMVVKSNRMEPINKLKVDHKCIGLAYYVNHLYVSSKTAIYMYTITGQLIKKLYEDITSKETISRFAISGDGTRVYITCTPLNRLIMIKDGNQSVTTVFVDSELTSPTGVCVTATGHVLVCGKDSNAVIQVDKDGQNKMKMVAGDVHGVFKPQVLWVNTNSTKLIVGQCTDSLLVLDIK